MRKKSKSSFCQIDHLELRRLLSATLFVSAAAPGPTHDGSSWANAYTDLQAALTAATSGTTIEVGQGTYKPTTDTTRTLSFHLVDGVTIQGGYAGTGQSNPDARNPALYPSILSGDIGTAGDNTDNSYHVVYARSVDNTAVLDGFTITAGNANVGPGTTTQGGGVFDLLASPAINDCTISGNASTGSGGGVVNLYSSATLTNCTISGNTSAARGGGIYDYQSSPSLTNCTISANTAHEGGGISNKKSSDAILSNCTISGNTAATGGGIANYKSSSPELTDCILAGNTATEEGGGVWNDLNSSPTLINCVISGNASIFGGGGVFSESTSNPTLTNCTFNGNTARYGGAIYNNSDASATLTNSILWGDTASISDNEIGSGAAGTNTTNISFSDVEGGSNGVNNNIVADPKFVRTVGAGGPGDFGNLRLQSSSPAIGAGNASASGLSGITTDLDGLSRTVSSHVDMGAYEAHYAFQSTVFVDASATGANTGSTWANAYSNLAVAMDYAVAGETIDVAQGTYYASTDASRFDTFQLIDGVSVEGGFAGQANPDAARNVSAYPSILSGDIGVVGNNSDNSYHVVITNGTDSTAVLDGFTITGGKANGTNSNAYGGGILNISGAPTINDCTLTGNSATYGGGMYDGNNSAPMLTNCIITGNIVTAGGGAMFNRGSSPTLINCVIAGNTAIGSGGIADFSSTLILTNCTITGNTASTFDGGGVYGANSSETLTNCILWSDTAHAGGNEIDSANGDSVIVTFSDIDQTGFAGSNNNIDADPMFVRNAGTNGASDFGDLNLKLGSPAIDVGSNQAILGTTTDINGNPRTINGTVDMGAYEARPIIFVDAHATGTDDGTSFANAFTTLTDAISHEISGSGQSIDVAQGTYKPTAGTDRTATFQLFDGVSLEGGFAGDTTANPGQRNVALFTTILSGDIGVASDNSDNSYHVVTGSKTDNTASLDGFTITGGNSGSHGGGIANYYGSPSIGHCIITGNTAGRGGGIYDFHSSPVILDCTISSNTAISGGGIENNYGSSPILSDCTITGNTATGDAGGGIDNYYYSSPTLTNCAILQNHALRGGGLAAARPNSDPVLTDCIISGNTAGDQGGGLFNYSGTLSLINCAISGNTSEQYGGGIYSYANSSLTLTNCTISGNNAASKGGAIYNGANGSATVSNSILWGNTATGSGNEILTGHTSTTTVTFSDVQGGFTGTGNINADPQFVRAVGTNGVSDFGDLHILNTSPAVNVGSNAAIPNGITTDLDGNTRIIASTVDMGAYEAQFTHLVFDVAPHGNHGAGDLLPIEVDVEDGNGNDVTNDNSSVTLQVAGEPAGASLNGTHTLTVQNGQAIFSGVNITQAGTYTISASDGSLPGATSGSFTITPGAAAALSISQQPVATIAGQDIPLTVQVKDSFGNLVDGTSVNVAITLGSSTGTLNGTTPLATTGGIANFSDLTIDQSGTYSFTITDGSFPAMTSSDFAINPAASAKLVFIIPPTDTVAGQTMAGFAVEVEDQFGNLAINDTSTVSLTSAPAGITASVAANHGIAEFTNVSSTAAGAYTLSATDGSLTSATSTTFNITPAAAAQLVISQQPASTTAGQNIPVTIEVKDQFGNLVDGSSVTLAIATGPSGANLGGTLTLPTTGGIATFNNITLDRAGAFTLSATDGSLAAVTTNSFTITYAGPQLVFITEPTNIVAGAKIPAFRVSPEDINGNPLLTNKSKITIRSSAGKLLGTSTASVKNGVAIFKNLSFQQAGSYTFQISDSGFGSALSNTITIAPGAAAKMVFTPQPSNVAHGTPFNVSVDLFDRYGNLATNNSSTVELTLGSKPKTATFANLMATVTDGAADFDATILTVPGNYTLGAIDGKLKAKSGKFVVS